MSAYYLCTCGKEFGKRELNAAIKHWRTAHPDDGYGCWDSLGSIGDAFSTQVIEHYREKLKRSDDKLRAAEEKAKAYDALVPRFRSLGRFLRASKDAYDAAAAYEELATKAKP